MYVMLASVIHKRMGSVRSDLPSWMRNHLHESAALYRDTKSPSRRLWCHCSRIRRPRFPHLAPSHILQDTDPKPLPHIRSPAKKRSAPRPGSATHGYIRRTLAHAPLISGRRQEDYSRRRQRRAKMKPVAKKGQGDRFSKSRTR